jgi:L-lactate dehydrogenase complex protein LldG
VTETARDVILARIRAALDAAPATASVPRAYLHRDARDRNAIIAELVERLRDYKAQVQRVEALDLPSVIAGICAQQAIRRLVVPVDMPAQWIPAEVTVLRDGPPLSNQQLDQSDGVLTGCAFAIAQTGTLVLNGGAFQGRRVLSLVPDRHLCVVREDQVVGIVPEGIGRLLMQPARPITFISGPSATSDIELSRVEGVHGPRSLFVILIEETK